MFLPSDQAAIAQHFWTLWRWFHFSSSHQSAFFILNKPGARFIHLTLCLHSSWLCNTSVCYSVTNIQRSWVSEFKPSSLPLPSWLSEYYGVRGTWNVFLNVCTTGVAFRVLTCSSSQGCGEGQSHKMLLKHREVLDESHYGNEHVTHSALSNPGAWNYKLRTRRAGRYPHHSSTTICLSWLRVSSI